MKELIEYSVDLGINKRGSRAEGREFPRLHINLYFRTCDCLTKRNLSTHHVDVEQ